MRNTRKERVVNKSNVKPDNPRSNSWFYASRALYVIGAICGLFALCYGISSENFVDQKQTAEMKVSIIMAAHNENQYLKKTIDSIMNNTPLDVLSEIILVDDASEPPARMILDELNYPLLKVIRNEDRQGLIRSKTIGSRGSSGEILVFLDAHVRTYPGWLEPLVKLTSENYRRIAVPMIPVLDETTWEQIDDFVGMKLIFDWKMDFIWYTDDLDDYVPVMSGGLLAITRRWFQEAGEYDSGMLMWGGENVEQSVKTWLCGGEIILARESRVGHVFRAVSPYVINTTQIHMNKARAIDVWFDEWAGYYYRANPFDKERRASKEALASRFAIKDRLGCRPFSTFVDKFKRIFEKYHLLPVEVFAIKHVSTGLCVALHRNGTFSGTPCEPDNRSQIFIPEEWKRLRSGKFVDDCIEVRDDRYLKANLCSAHEAGQLNLSLDSDGELRKRPRDGSEGPTICMHMSPQGELSMESCGSEHRFVKLFVKPYDHSIYK